MNQAPLCPDYMAFGEVTSRIDASHLVSGTIELDRLPRIDLTKIPLGTDGYFLKGKGVSDPEYALLTSGDIPSLPASQITSGVFADARIPDLPASKITSGIFGLAMIPTMDDAHIPDLATLASSVFDLARIPVMNDARIPDLETLSYGGSFASAQIPNLSANKITSDVLALARIPTIPASKIEESARLIIHGRGSIDAGITEYVGDIWLPSGKYLKLWALNRYCYNTLCYVEIYNATDATSMDSHNNSAHEEGTPIHSWSYGADKRIAFRLRNTDDVSRLIAGNWVFSIE